MNETIKSLKETLEGSFLQPNINANIGSTERILSVATGAYFAFAGLKNVFSHPLIAIGEITLGGSLLKRGVTGFCSVTAKFEEQKFNDISMVGVRDNAGNL
jgi:hypothetical protein